MSSRLTDLSIIEKLLCLIFYCLSDCPPDVGAGGRRIDRRGGEDLHQSTRGQQTWMQVNIDISICFLKPIRPKTQILIFHSYSVDFVPFAQQLLLGKYLKKIYM